MEQVGYDIPGAVATYSAKSALFSATYADRGTFFESTGSFTITLDTTSMSAGWSAWFRTVSGTQTFDPTSTVQINGATTYAVSNAGDVVLVTYSGTAFQVAHVQRPSTVAITGGTVNGATIGATTPAAGVFTSVAVRDSANDHSITIDTASDEAADRTITIPAMGGNRTLPLLENTQSWSGVNTVTNATDSTSASTGALPVSGGIAAAKNVIAAQGFGHGVSATVTAAATTTLTSASRMIQTFTGSTTQIIQFPAANIFGAGIAVMYCINNQSSGTVTPTRAGADTFQGGGTTDPVLAGATQWYASDGVSVWLKI